MRREHSCLGSEIEIDEPSGISLTHCNREHPEQHEGGPQDLCPHVAHRGLNTSVIIEAMGCEKNHEQQKYENIRRNK